MEFAQLIGQYQALKCSSYTLGTWRAHRDTSWLSYSTAVTLVRYWHTETHWSVDLTVHTAVTLVRYGQTLVRRLSSFTAVTLVRYGQRHWSVDLAVHTAVTLISRLSCFTAVTLVRYRDTLVSQLSCFTAVTLVRYGQTDTLVAVPQQLHWSDTDKTETLVSRLSYTHNSYTGQIRTKQRHTGQST